MCVTLNHLYQKYPDVRLSYLVEDKNATFEELMARLTLYRMYSPESDMLTEEIAGKVRAKAWNWLCGRWTTSRRRNG